MSKHKKVESGEDLTKLKIIFPENGFLPLDTNVNALAYAKLMALRTVWMPASLISRLQVRCTQNPKTAEISLCWESRT